MAWKGARVLAVALARGASKGIPRKNLSIVGGMSLIARIGSVVATLPWIDTAVLSTDDAEIAKEGLSCGLRVPFMRPPELATDEATSVDAWKHAWLATEALDGWEYPISVLLEPTSPLRTADDVRRTVSTLVEGSWDAAMTLTRTPAHYTPEKSLIVDGSRVAYGVADGAQHTRRQTICPYYHRNGICYALRREAMLRGASLVDNCAAVVIERPVANIDEPLDVVWAGFLLAQEAASQSGPTEPP